MQLRIRAPLLDRKRCPSSQPSPFSIIRTISTNFSAGFGCSFQLVILFEISSDFSCLLSAVSQSILFTRKRIFFFLGRLINFECCRVCPWTSLRSSRRETRCTSCQRCCEHVSTVFRVPRFKGRDRSQRGRL